MSVAIVYGIGLDHTPPYLHHDEVVISLQAHSIATTGRDLDGRLLPLYFRMPQLSPRTWFHPMAVYVTAASQFILPFSEPWLRVPTVMISVVNVLLMFLVARRLFASDAWGLGAALLLAITPAHFLHGRVVFDFIYPLPFVLGWLLGLVVFLDRRRTSVLFVTSLTLGVGFYSYIASMVMMPIYFALTIGVLLATRTASPRNLGAAAAGFALPLLLLIPWLTWEPAYIADQLSRYRDVDRLVASASAASLRGALSLDGITERLKFYWSFLNPAFLFLIGGYTRPTNSTARVAPFLAPFLVLVPLGIYQVLTRRRSPVPIVILLGFFLAPIAPALSVLEHYAVGRELAVLVFGVLLAMFGIERLLSSSGAWSARIAYALVIALSLNFLFFQYDYYGDYHRRSAWWFDRNHRDALEAVLALETGPVIRPVYLSRADADYVEAYWLLATAKRGRQDLLSHTTYFDDKTFDHGTLPPGSLIVATSDDRNLMALAKTGGLTEVMRALEPADDPVFFVFQSAERK